ACWPSSTPLPASLTRPSAQAMPRPTSRGWRTHQKASTSATKSGTRRRSRQGRKSRNSARANEAMMVLARAGTRIDLSGDIGGLGLRRLPRGFLDPRAARLVQAAPLARLHVVRARRTLGVVGQHQHEEAAVDTRGGPADDAREG